ncbi:IS6 family transposase [Listeria monocytogenes]|nr:IS6 family transposase [Listeria monocytogenes]PXF04154.1 IS6 family transposase [Listeria monocytogenes]
MNHFKGKQFKKDVIIVAVGYYLRYNLSYREVQELLYDRGINVCHTTIYRWVQEYSKVLYYLWKKKNRQSFYSWKMDETYIKIKGRWHYLYRAIDADGLTLDIWLRKKRDTQAAYAFLKRYRAIDADGLTLDIWLRKKRDTQAAYAFLKRLHKQFGEPKAIVTDKAPSLGSAFRKLQSVGLYTKTEHRTVKYLNNLIEQDHRPIKRRNKFYQSLRTASSTIKGMETIRGIYKKNRRNGTLFGFSVSTEIKVLMGITA